MEIIDYGLSIEENDLVALVVGKPDANEPTTRCLAVILLQYFSKKLHELAEDPITFLCEITADMGVPSLTIEISGENLAISVVFEDPTARAEASTLCIFDWRNGKRKTRIEHRIPVFNGGLVFLREDILVNPNGLRKSIDIYHILPSASILASDPSRSAIRLIHSLLLPTLAPGANITSLSCRCSPNPTSGSRFPRFAHKNQPYTFDPTHAVIYFVMDVFRANAWQTFALIVHRQSLLDLIPLDRIDPDMPGCPVYEGIRVRPSLQEGADRPLSMQPWETWGPPITRWFSDDYISGLYIACVSGRRYVQYAPSHGQRRDTIHVFNFNPAFVRIARHCGLNRGGEAVDIETVDGNPRDSDTDSELEENVCSAKGFFASDLVGRLPYVRSTSKKEWDHDEVLMSEERLLGLKKIPNRRRLKSVSVIYFGPVDSFFG